MKCIGFCRAFSVMFSEQIHEIRAQIIDNKVFDRK